MTVQNNQPTNLFDLHFFPFFITLFYETYFSLCTLYIFLGPIFLIIILLYDLCFMLCIWFFIKYFFGFAYIEIDLIWFCNKYVIYMATYMAFTRFSYYFFWIEIENFMFLEVFGKWIMLNVRLCFPGNHGIEEFAINGAPRNIFSSVFPSNTRFLPFRRGESKKGLAIKGSKLKPKPLITQNFWFF